MRARQRREGLPGPRQRRAARRHVQDPVLQQARWHDHPQRRDAEVRRPSWERQRGARGEAEGWALAAAAVLVAVAAIGGVVVLSGAEHPTAAAQAPPANTVKVETGELSAMVSQDGTLTYRARSDGSPYSVINQARGVVHRAARERGQGRLRRRALPGGRHAGAAAVRHGPGLPRAARGRRRAGTSVSSTATCTCSARRRRRVDPAHFTTKTETGARGAPAQTRALDVTGALAHRRRGLPARGGADRQGHRRARRIRPAGCAGR